MAQVPSTRWSLAIGLGQLRGADRDLVLKAALDTPSPEARRCGVGIIPRRRFPQDVHGQGTDALFETAASLTDVRQLIPTSDLDPVETRLFVYH